MRSGRFVLAGGSGFLGQALAADLAARGHGVVILTRSPREATGAIRYLAWDGKTIGKWAEALDGAEAVVNLAGRSVNTRYTSENRREIISSRVDSVDVIGRAIAACASPPRVWVQSGSLAIYGDAGDSICDESTQPGEGFSAHVCVLWERAFDAVQTPETRKVLLRIGFALGRDGGALHTLARLARLGLGGSAGSGRQYISWLHLEDLNRMARWCVEHDQIEGVLNATGPNPVTNAEFMRSMRHALHRPWSPPVLSPLVRVGARLMGTEASLALTGRRCAPRRFLEEGFIFEYSRLPEALNDLLA